MDYLFIAIIFAILPRISYILQYHFSKTHSNDQERASGFILETSNTVASSKNKDKAINIQGYT